MKTNFGVTDDTEAFALWGLCHTTAGLSERDAYDDVYVGSKDDKSLDGFLIDHDRKIVNLYQSKYHTAETNFGDRAALDDFVGVLGRLKDEKLSKEFKSPNIRSCARQYRDAVSRKYDVTLKFIVYARVTPALRDEAQVIEKQLPARHSLQVWDFGRLERQHYELLAFEEPISEAVELRLADKSYATMRTPKAEAVVVSILGTELYDLRKKHGRRLFTKDVRYFLRGSQINKQIAHTLEMPSDREYFWYYNNGISVTCSDYDIDEKKGIITLKQPQIINGCQTAESIFNFGEAMGYHNLERVAVIARVIKTKDKLLGGNITARTNTQNPQTARNLCANLPSQINLAQLFDELAPPVFYQTKDGEWDSLPQFKKDRHTGRDGIERVIDNRDAAQAYIAFARDDELLNPVQARRMRTQIFDITEDTYADVFPDPPRSPYEFLVPYLFLNFVESKLGQIRKELAGVVPKSDEEWASYESRNSLRYAKWFIMGILGWLVRYQYKCNELEPKVAMLLASEIGDFAGPSELGKSMLDFAFDLVEEYSGFCASSAEKFEEEFDPALAYRQAPVWKDLKRNALTRYKRLIDRKIFKMDLFPALV